MKQMRGTLFVDIGSNQGVYSRIGRRQFKKTVTIDPNPQWNADYQLALSDHDGHETFYLGDGKGAADSIMKNPHILGKAWQNESIYDVETRTFDSLGLDADLVKIDVEGAEFKVINGMNGHLPRAAIIELHDERRERELLDKMSKKGYSASQIDNMHWLFKLCD